MSKLIGSRFWSGSIIVVIVESDAMSALPGCRGIVKDAQRGMRLVQWVTEGRPEFWYPLGQLRAHCAEIIDIEVKEEVHEG